MQNIYIQLGFLIALWFEALHDYAVISLQNYQHTRYKELSEDWHTFSAIQTCIIIVLITWLSGWWWLAACLLLLRSSAFPMALNLLREKPLFYIGTTGFDGTIKKIFGSIASEVLYIGSILAILTINIYL